MIESDTPRHNHLLSALPTAEYERLLPHMERVQMPLGHVIYESGDALDYGYFPTTCIVSKIYIMENGASSEIAVVGNDGIVAFSCSWAAQPCQIGPSCGARVVPIECKSNTSCRNAIAPAGVVAAHCNICCCVIPKH